MITRIHKNLHNNRWSITQKGLVVGYADDVILREVTVAINNNIKAKHSHKRTVHTWCLGELVDVVNFTPLKGRTVTIGETDQFIDDVRSGYFSDYPKIEVIYNPFKHEYLTIKCSDVEYTGGDYAVFTATNQMFSL